jgi:hypothetical protein
MKFPFPLLSLALDAEAHVPTEGMVKSRQTNAANRNLILKTIKLCFKKQSCRSIKQNIGGEVCKNKRTNMAQTLKSEQGLCLKSDMHKYVWLFPVILMKWLILLSWKQGTAVIKS